MENPQNLYELADMYDDHDIEAEEKHDPEELYEQMSTICSTTNVQKPAVEIKKKLPYLQIVLLVLVLAVLVLILILQIGLYAGCTCGSNTVPLTGDSSILNNSPNCTCNNEKLTKLDKLLQIVQNISEQGNTMGTLHNNTTLLLSDIVSSLSVLNDTSTSTAGTSGDVLQRIGELQIALSSLMPFNYYKSCEDVKTLFPNAPSGHYNINDTNVYCHMGELCGSEGGWTRLAYLNMSDSTEICPCGFKLYESGGVRACGRPFSNTGSCLSVNFPSFGISYSEICGRVIGYQYGSTDGVHDGVTIYRGPLDQHVWTLMAGMLEYRSSGNDCPCNTYYNGINVSSIIGTHYFCESGSPNGLSFSLNKSDPLWDGEGCGNNEIACCSTPGLPWFHRTYDVDTTDYITLKLCCDDRTLYEDIPIGFYEIYVK